MYSGLLPKGLTEEDLSPDEAQDDTEDDVEGKTECEGSAENFDSTCENKGSGLEVQSTHTGPDTDSDPQKCSMPGISQDMWQVC